LLTYQTIRRKIPYYLEALHDRKRIRTFSNLKCFLWASSDISILR
ncbi:hypothetical protein TNCT_212581, partial [Trichonephila clavata]